MSELLAHRRDCGKRSIVKVEYVNSKEGMLNSTFNQSKFTLLDFDQRPDQEYKPHGNVSNSNKQVKPNSNFANLGSEAASYGKKKKSKLQKKTKPNALQQKRDLKPKKDKYVNESARPKQQVVYDLTPEPSSYIIPITE